MPQLGAWWVIGSGGDNVNYPKTGIINPLYYHLFIFWGEHSVNKDAKDFVNYFAKQKLLLNLFCWNHVKHSLEPTIRKTFDRKIWVRRMVIGRVGLRLLQTLIIENIWELWAHFLSIKVWANGQYIRKLARIILFYFASLFLFLEKN